MDKKVRLDGRETTEIRPIWCAVGLDAVAVAVEMCDEGARIVVTAEVAGRTGVEMEAMTGAAMRPAGPDAVADAAAGRV